MVDRAYPAPPFEPPDGEATRAPSVVLAAVDISRPESQELPIRILRAAERLAAREETELHVAYAWSIVGESILTCPVRGIPHERLRAIRARVHRVWCRRLERLCDGVLSAPPAGIHVARGNARAVVPALARRLRAAVVVVGAPGSGGTLGRGRRFDAAARLQCDVLALRARRPDSCDVLVT